MPLVPDGLGGDHCNLRLAPFTADPLNCSGGLVGTVTRH